MQLPILSGIFTDNDPSLRTSYPVNLIPVVKPNGVSNSFLRPADGVIENGTGPGVGRGGINWNDVLYRVMGDQLVRIDSAGTVTSLGSVGGTTENVTMDYSFDRLAIASNGNLFYYDDTNGLVQVTDPDIGTVLDVQWIDGYFMTTDGEFLVVTELSDPTQVNPLKYGSSEIDPDPVVALVKLRNEIYAVNRYTIEVFNNVGGNNFPFQRREGAQIQKGCVGTHACCIYLERIAFIGSNRNEQNSVYLGINGGAQQISTREIDDILEEYTEAQLSKVKLEVRNDRSSELLYIHLPDRCLVYDAEASQALGQPVWFVLTSSFTDFEEYRAKHLIYCYNDWQVCDTKSSSIGTFTDTIGSHWGNKTGWRFSTNMVYNEGNGAIFGELELVALTGRTEFDKNPRISTSYSLDGVKWSQDRWINSGKTGDTLKRLVWYRQGLMRNFRIQRFRGDSDSHISFLRLEAELEPLAN